MANCCEYGLKAVAKDMKTLERLVEIMDYKDNEYYIYRCQDVNRGDEDLNDGLYSLIIYGDVAWSCSNWINTIEDFGSLNVIGYEKDQNGRTDYNKPIYGSAHYITLDLICKKLGIGLEIYSSEPGMCFQEHIVVNHLGSIEDNKCVEWEEIWEDEDGNDLDEPISKGGFPTFGKFMSETEIYNFGVN